MMKELVSIIIPVYNREMFISKTLGSIQQQSYKNWECIIVDDGSIDSTLNKIQYFINADERFKVFSRPVDRKKGASSCRNYGLELIKGDLVQFLDSDDLLHRDKLLKQVGAYHGGNVLLTGKWGGFITESDLKSRFKYKFGAYRDFNTGIELLNNFGHNNEFFPLHVYLTPRSLINEAGYWDEVLANNDDAEFFTRVILEADAIRFVPEAVAYYRYEVSGNLSAVDSKSKMESLIKSWKKIEEHLKKRNLSQSYVQNAKFEIHRQLKIVFPDIIQKEKLFFRDQQNGKQFDNINWLRSKIWKFFKPLIYR